MAANMLALHFTHIEGLKWKQPRRHVLLVVKRLFDRKHLRSAPMAPWVVV